MRRTRGFQPHRQATERRSSAASLIKLMLQNRDPSVLASHRNELLTILLWKLTEAESDHKHRTRFQSEGALACTERKLLRHEHVFQRNKMIEELLQSEPTGLDNILANAIGCTVTVEEHKRLAAYEDEYGWERYRKARVIVVDTMTGTPLGS